MYELSLDSPYDGVDLGGYKYVKARDLEDEDIDKLSRPSKEDYEGGGGLLYVDYEAEGVDGGFLLSQNDYERFRKQDISGINRLSIFYLLVILLTFLFNYFQVLILNYTAQKIIFNMREEIFNHVKSLAVSYFDKNPIGRLVTRVTNDTETLNEMYSNVPGHPGQGCLNAFGYHGYHAEVKL